MNRCYFTAIYYKSEISVNLIRSARCGRGVDLTNSIDVFYVLVTAGHFVSVCTVVSRKISPRNYQYNHIDCVYNVCLAYICTGAFLCLTKYSYIKTLSVRFQSQKAT